MFRESIVSVRGFRARFASQLVQFGALEQVSRVNWSSSGLQSAFRESIGSVRDFGSAYRKSFDSSRMKKTRRALMIRKLNVIL